MVFMSSKTLYQGRYVPQNPAKYRGDPTNVIYRSGWELRFMKWCDVTQAVIEWGSEEIVVPYRSPVDNNLHRYFIDFYIKVRDKAGQLRKYFIEIKPLKYTMPPKEPTRKTRRYVEDVKTYIVNQAKWESAKSYAQKAGAQFMILTEQDLGLDFRKGS